MNNTCILFNEAFNLGIKIEKLLGEKEKIQEQLSNEIKKNPNWKNIIYKLNIDNDQSDNYCVDPEDIDDDAEINFYTTITHDGIVKIKLTIYNPDCQDWGTDGSIGIYDTKWFDSITELIKEFE